MASQPSVIFGFGRRSGTLWSSCFYGIQETGAVPPSFKCGRVMLVTKQGRLLSNPSAWQTIKPLKRPQLGDVAAGLPPAPRFSLCYTPDTNVLRTPQEDLLVPVPHAQSFFTLIFDRSEGASSPPIRPKHSTEWSTVLVLIWEGF